MCKPSKLRVAGSNPVAPIGVLNMSGVSDLDTLLKAMKPKLIGNDFVFCTLEEEKLNNLNAKLLLTFREKEGITVVVKKKEADKNRMKYSGTWAMITLTVHSDLNAIGFLAAITKKLADAKISVNAVSAFYHDHLFVPSEKAEKAIEILNKISAES